MGVLKTSTLALGSRQDAATWDKGCQSVGVGVLSSIRKATPTIDELKAFFAGAPSWLFLGGHFSSLSLFNDAAHHGKAGAVSIDFANDRLTIDVDGTTASLSQADGTFMMDMTAVVILWGGCSVCDSHRTIRTLRNLFGKHVLLGFSGVTGWAIVDAVLGNGFIKEGHFFDNVKGKTEDLDAVTNSWMKAAQKGYGSGSVGSGFRAVDYDGQGWKLDKGKIVKWIKV